MNNQENTAQSEDSNTVTTGGTNPPPPKPRATVVSAPELAPKQRPTATLVDAADLAKQADTVRPYALRRRWLNDNDSVLVRPVSRQLARAGLHFGIADVTGSKHVLLCNVEQCVLCLAQYKASPQLFTALYFLDDQNLGVLDFPEHGGPGSLATQLIPLLARPDATDLVVELSRSGRLFTVKYVSKLDPNDVDADADFGGDVLRDRVARGEGDLQPETLVSTVPQWDNQTILARYPSVARKLRVLRSDLDLAKL